MKKEIKLEHLKKLDEYRSSIISHPPLRSLFFELTLRCNEKCIHCGSSCNDVKSVELPQEEYIRILDEVKRDFDISRMMLNITGGEPLLRKDFFDIMAYAKKLGFTWGMTTNGTLVDDDVAKKLYDCGMKTVSVSIDGLEDTHDRLRSRKGAFKETMRGINALVNLQKFNHVQVTTVINHENFSEILPLFELLGDIDIDSWRIVNIEPMGRAKKHPELVLTNEEYKYLFDFIKEKRTQGYPICYGCGHFLGLDYEREVRDWYFLCNAGLYTASIASNGDILSCLDIERRQELIQGNILKDNLRDVWDNRFKFFRKDLSCLNTKCAECDQNRFCHGGSFHSWDYDKNEPIVCFKDILF